MKINLKFLIVQLKYNTQIEYGTNILTLSGISTQFETFFGSILHNIPVVFNALEKCLSLVFFT